MIELTICTPTYNRAHCLSMLYKSLCIQTNTNFEWLIIDDGSIDETELLVKEWIDKEKKFEIRYIKKKNGGKHTAINYGVKNAKGNIFFIVDSDDYLIEKAVEVILFDIKSLPEEKFAGIGYNKQFVDGSLVGGTFEGNYIDATALERPKYNIQGDKAEVFYTELLKKYPFPVFDDEHFLTEALVWNRIAYDGYKLRWYNKAIYICEYRNDGLSMNASNINNFKGYTLFIQELMGYKAYPLKEKIKWLGVYSDISHHKGLTYNQIRKITKENIFFIILSRYAYFLKKAIKIHDRKEEYKVIR